MNRSEMNQQIKKALKIALPILENDICRLHGMLTLGKKAIRSDDCDEFEQLIDKMGEIDDHLECVVVFGGSKDE